MKGKIIAIVVLVVGCLLVSGIPVQDADAAYTWYSDREAIEVNSYNVTDGYMNATRDYGAWASTGDENISGNFSLPAPMSDATSATWYVYNNDSDATNMNLTYNGVLLADNNTVNAGVEWTGTCSVASHDESYVNWSFNATDAVEGHTFLNFTIHYEEVTITKSSHVTGSEGLVSSIVERYKTNPEVAFDSDNSIYAVEDKITVNLSVQDNTNNSVELHGTTLYLTMPSHKESTPSDISIGYINDTTAPQNYLLGYQKKGPYVSRMGDPTKDSLGDYELGVRLYTYEAEKDVTWTFDPTSTDLSEYFPELDTDTLQIEIDGKDVDFTTGSIETEEFDLDSGETTAYFSWTPEAEEPIEPTEPTEEEVDWFMVIAGTLIILGLLAIVIVVYRNYYE